MHARELIELAAFVAAEGSTLLHSVRQISSEATAQYWMASKCRLDRWGRALRGFRQHVIVGPGHAEISWSGVRGVCEEVLASEMLVRVWTCVVLAAEQKLGTGDAEPLINSVYSGHLEATNRVLNVIALEGIVPARGAAELNRLRRLMERWTDLVLGRLGKPFAISTVAFNAERAQEFAEEFAIAAQTKQPLEAWPLLTASLRGTFAHRLQAETPNSDLNSRIAGAIVACFPAEMFDSVGVYHSLWQSRLLAMASDTQVMVDELLDVERPRKFR